jgi:hypothetical protein
MYCHKVRYKNQWICSYFLYTILNIFIIITLTLTFAKRFFIFRPVNCLSWCAKTILNIESNVSEPSHKITELFDYNSVEQLQNILNFKRGISSKSFRYLSNQSDYTV